MNATEHEIAHHRDAVVAYLRRQLVGPPAEEHERLADPPDRRYLMGTLYPRGTALHREALNNGEDETSEGMTGSGEEDAFADDPVAEANAWLPSSLGFSFYTDAPKLAVTCRAARYVTVQEAGRRVWDRQPSEKHTEILEVGQTQRTVLDGHAQILVRWRQFRGGHLVTCVLANVHREEEAQDKHVPRWDLMLFQVELEVETIDGRVLEYPSSVLNSQDPEEQELRVQYRHIVTRAVGHGCAVDWRGSQSATTVVRAETMPQAIVDHVSPDGPRDLPVLRLSHLSRRNLDPDELQVELLAFLAGYRDWLSAREAEAASLPGWTQQPAKRILDRIRAAVERMEAGVAVLTARDGTGEMARTAFRLANRAMALQMRHAGRDLAGSRRRRDEPVPGIAEPDPSAAWHPFQLGFFLLIVRSLVEPTHEDRQVVDLIWFPTGGGKTEAYLLAACFEIVWRRLRHGAKGHGTAVLSRYTLSLLTTQQFQRAATAICALDYLRRGRDGDHAKVLGDKPITIGLWVGRDTTPNSYSAAEQALGELLQMNQPDDRFLLERCPWCGTEIVPERHGPRDAYGIEADHASFRFRCPRSDCEFADFLPVAVVDDHLYAEPPTFLLGTVDKFARLAWEPQAGSLFGRDGTLAPSLIIQDELHLLAGPLGTTVGLYECAILELCGWRGVPPKVIASTATIRRSHRQIENLYGRPAQLFPPAGLDARFSYFAAPDHGRPGRLYVGVMAQGHTASTAIVHTGAASLQAPVDLEVDGALRDAYWTLVAYHNSLRELGRTVTIARDDIPARLRHLKPDPDSARPLGDDATVELTSNIPRSAQPRLLERLAKSCDEKGCISFLATTNMLSVGVDVARLGFMVMNGQPKTTSEYIQATSRVGRSRVPGLVVTLFGSTKPRDRSHYEAFGVYHSSLYRHVEPTSVTPWSVPSRRRALHAVLAILVRHGLGLHLNDQAGDILDHTEAVEEIRGRIVAHVRRADTREADMVGRELTALINEWVQEATVARGEGRRLYWNAQGKGHMGVLRDFGKQGGLWETPQSMRNVDRDCLLAVRGA